jgi:hypothetical protein
MCQIRVASQAPKLFERWRCEEVFKVTRTEECQCFTSLARSSSDIAPQPLHHYAMGTTPRTAGIDKARTSEHSARLMS